jgi:hypothetical protein
MLIERLFVVSVSNLELRGSHSNVFFGRFIMERCYFCFINYVAAQTVFIQLLMHGQCKE